MNYSTERSVVYLMSYPAHAPYLATSLLSLRRYWSGRIKIFAWKESIDIARMLANDKRIEADVMLDDPSYKGKNSQFLHKIQLMQDQSSGPNLYLDADTLPAGQLTEMFTSGKYFGFAATQFNDWDTSGNLIRGRIEKLRDFPVIDRELIDRVTTECLPSVNGGVFCCMPDSPVLPVWRKWSHAARSAFICDECVLHLMVPLFQDQDRLSVMPGIFNSSPKYVPQSEAVSVRIWHGHGDCWVRPAKSREGWAMWHSAMQDARRLNIGGIEGWFRSVGNKFLDELIRGGEFA